MVREGINPERIQFVGNLMIDIVMSELPKASELEMPRPVGLEWGRYVLSTLHRPSNVDDADALRRPWSSGEGEPRDVLPIVIRRRGRMPLAIDLGRDLEALTVIEPVEYLEMISLTDGAAVVLTDSGGVQEETTVLGVCCVTLREQTERPVRRRMGPISWHGGRSPWTGS